MSRGLVFPNPTQRGDRWDVYSGGQTILSPDQAAAVAVEADWLLDPHNRFVEPYLSTFRFEGGDQRDDNFTSHALRLRSDNQPHVFDGEATTAIRRRIPNLLKFIDDVENRIGVEKQDVVINSMSPNGRIANHKDGVDDTVVAVGVAGFAWVSLGNLSRKRYRFPLGPGNGFVAHNFGDEQLRPAHGLSNRGGTERLSIAL